MAPAIHPPAYPTTAPEFKSAGPGVVLGTDSGVHHLPVVGDRQSQRSLLAAAAEGKQYSSQHNV